MPRARRTKRFWVIRWKGDQVRKDFFHVLPATRTSKPILDCMIGLYFNSPSLLISERMNRVHSTLRRNVKSQDLGTRIIVGDNPFLVAYEVEDLVVVQDRPKALSLYPILNYQHIASTKTQDGPSPPDYRKRCNLKEGTPKAVKTDCQRTFVLPLVACLYDVMAPKTRAGPSDHPRVGPQTPIKSEIKNWQAQTNYKKRSGGMPSSLRAVNQSDHASPK